MSTDTRTATTVNYKPYTSSKRITNVLSAQSNQSRHNSSSSLSNLHQLNDGPSSSSSRSPPTRPSSWTGMRPNLDSFPSESIIQPSSGHPALSSPFSARSPISSSSSASPSNCPSPMKYAQVPFRPGFQARGVYRDRTETLINARRSKQEFKRLEESRLQKRLEKLIVLHFLSDSKSVRDSAQSNSGEGTERRLLPTSFSSLDTGSYLSQKMFDFVKSSTRGGASENELSFLGRGASMRLREQQIVRWQEDSEAKACRICQTAFGIRVRKHHCRLCGTVVCFLPPSSTGKKERCSTMISFESDSAPGLGEKWVGGKIIELSEQEMGIAHEPHDMLDLITSAGNPGEAGVGTKKNRNQIDLKSQRKGVRVCRQCLVIVLRRQAMTFPPEIPDYVQLYEILKNLQDEVRRTLPEFQELMLSSKHSSSNLNPSPTPTPSLRLINLRKKILTKLTSYDSVSKRLTNLSNMNSAEERLIKSMITRASFFLRDHMSLIRSIGGYEIENPTKPKRVMNKPQGSSTPVNNKTPTRNVRSELFIEEDQNDIDKRNQIQSGLIQLNVLLEQERLVEGYLQEAKARRQLEDAASLKTSLDDLF